MAQGKTNERAVRHLSTAFFVPFTSPDGNKAVLVRTARRGETIDVSTLAEGEEKRLESLGALLPAGSTSQDVAHEHQAVLDAYRSQRGDQEAMQRHMERLGGGEAAVVNVDAPDVASSSVGLLAEWIKDKKPNADDTVALAESDPALAQKMLEAETVATDGSPRQTVVDRLNKLAAGG